MENLNKLERNKLERNIIDMIFRPLQYSPTPRWDRITTWEVFVSSPPTGFYLDFSSEGSFSIRSVNYTRDDSLGILAVKSSNTTKFNLSDPDCFENVREWIKNTLNIN